MVAKTKKLGTSQRIVNEYKSRSRRRPKKQDKTAIAVQDSSRVVHVPVGQDKAVEVVITQKDAEPDTQHVSVSPNVRYNDRVLNCKACHYVQTHHYKDDINLKCPVCHVSMCVICRRAHEYNTELMQILRLAYSDSDVPICSNKPGAIGPLGF